MFFATDYPFPMSIPSWSAQILLLEALHFASTEKASDEENLTCLPSATNENLMGMWMQSPSTTVA